MTFVAIPWRSFVSFRQCQSSRIPFKKLSNGSSCGATVATEVSFG